MCLNPYCSGRKNRIYILSLLLLIMIVCLNPYCSGKKNRIWAVALWIGFKKSLNPYCSGKKNRMGD